MHKACSGSGHLYTVMFILLVFMHVHLHIIQNKVVWPVFLKAQENPCHTIVVLTELAVGSVRFYKCIFPAESMASCDTYTKATKPLSQTFTFTVC